MCESVYIAMDGHMYIVHVCVCCKSICPSLLVSLTCIEYLLAFWTQYIRLIISSTVKKNTKVIKINCNHNNNHLDDTFFSNSMTVLEKINYIINSVYTCTCTCTCTSKSDFPFVMNLTI